VSFFIREIQPAARFCDQQAACMEKSGLAGWLARPAWLPIASDLAANRHESLDQ
jgi:hypothetical protein